MHTSIMRTSITLDDDVYELASLYSRGKGITLGAAIGELVRRGDAAPAPEPDMSELVREPNGLLVFASRGRVITSEMVKAALEEDDK
jgi:hypothetical protein